MTIKQFNGHYDLREDRILFKFNTHQDSEYRLILTRFIVEKILQAVSQLIHHSLEKKHNAQIAKVIQEFQDDGVEKSANLSQQYLGAQNLPLGESPLLVIGMHLSFSDGQFLISFQLANNKTLNTKLSKENTQTMSFLLKKLAQKANWQVNEVGAVANPNLQSTGQLDQSVIKH
jgi:hypothetical protein